MARNDTDCAEAILDAFKFKMLEKLNTEEPLKGDAVKIVNLSDMPPLKGDKEKIVGLSDMPPPEEHEDEEKKGKRLKIITPNKLLTRLNNLSTVLPIILAQL